MRKIILKHLLVACVVFVCAAPAFACDIEQLYKINSDYDGLLADLATNDCLGGREADKANIWVKKVNGLLPDVEAENAALTRLRKVKEALDYLADESLKRAVRGVQSPQWSALSSELKESSKSLDSIDAKMSGEDALRVVEKALNEKWARLVRRGSLNLDGRNYDILAPTDCKVNPPAPCDTFESQADLVRQFHLVRRIRSFAQYDSLARHAADAILQTERWKSYGDNAKSQYFWEVGLNGLFLDCKKDPDTKVQLGFCKVPTSQFVLLHPSAAMRYQRDAKDSGYLKPALAVDLFGYYRWDWKDDHSSEMKNAFGASVVAAYSDAENGARWSYGPMFYFGPKYGIAVTRSPGERWSLILSIELGEFLGNKADSAQKLKNWKTDLPGLLKGF